MKMFAVLRVAAPALLLAVTPMEAPALIVADSADDVCEATADPCTVTDLVRVEDRAMLDFGTRTISVVDGGRFEFSDRGAVLCGDFLASTSGPALLTAEPTVMAEWVDVVARRACSGNEGDVPCVSDAQCQLGTCGVRRCERDPKRVCSSDAGCQGGTCSNNRCQNFGFFDQCLTNSDCDLGSCGSEITCSLDWGNTPLACSSNTDCQNGTCSIGTASIELDGAVVAKGGPGFRSLGLDAADSVIVSKPIDLSTADRKADGSSLTVRGRAGDVILAGRIRGSGGSLAAEVRVRAGRDAHILAPITAVGGWLEGGYVDVEAGRDAHLGASMNLRSMAQDGYGGSVDVIAGRDIQVDGGADSKRVRIVLSGHGFEDTGGGGGDIWMRAEGDVTFDERVRIVSMGARPDGDGGFLEVLAVGDIELDADVKIRGRQDGGGLMHLRTAGAARIGAGARIDVDESSVRAEGDVDLSGVIDVDAKHSTEAGAVEIRSGGTATLAGAIGARGKTGGSLEVTACRLILDDSSMILNDAQGGLTSLIARESMELRSGSTTSTPFGSNILTYRTPAKPPIVDGLVTPAPLLQVDALLPGCPVCGNSEIDESETCDDGNLHDGDGCSAGCQVE